MSEWRQVFASSLVNTDAGKEKCARGERRVSALWTTAARGPNTSFALEAGCLPGFAHEKSDAVGSPGDTACLEQLYQLK